MRRGISLLLCLVIMMSFIITSNAQGKEISTDEKTTIINQKNDEKLKKEKEIFHLASGSYYYETSQNGGLGAYGREGNDYVKEDDEIFINGYSIIEKSTGIIKDWAYLKSEKHIPIPDVTENEELMLHIVTEKFVLGWTSRKNICKDTASYDNGTSMEKDDILQNIEEDISNKKNKVYILVDVSGSMQENMASVVNEFYSLKNIDNANIVFFAEKIKEVKDPNIIKDWQLLNLGGATALFDAIHYVDGKAEKGCKIILFSDLIENASKMNSLNELKRISAIDVYVPERLGIEEDFSNRIDSNVNVKIKEIRQ